MRCQIDHQLYLARASAYESPLILCPAVSGPVRSDDVFTWPWSKNNEIVASSGILSPHQSVVWSLKDWGSQESRIKSIKSPCIPSSHSWSSFSAKSTDSIRWNIANSTIFFFACTDRGAKDLESHDKGTTTFVLRVLSPKSLRIPGSKRCMALATVRLAAPTSLKTT